MGSLDDAGHELAVRIALDGILIQHHEALVVARDGGEVLEHSIGAKVGVLDDGIVLEAVGQRTDLHAVDGHNVAALQDEVVVAAEVIMDLRGQDTGGERPDAIVYDGVIGRDEEALGMAAHQCGVDGCVDDALDLVAAPEHVTLTDVLDKHLEAIVQLDEVVAPEAAAARVDVVRHVDGCRSSRGASARAITAIGLDTGRRRREVREDLNALLLELLEGLALEVLEHLVLEVDALLQLEGTAVGQNVIDAP